MIDSNRPPRVTPPSSRPLACPICGRTIDPTNHPAMPFCSERCRLIDLGRWLGEEHGLPYERPEEEERSADEPRE